MHVHCRPESQIWGFTEICLFSDDFLSLWNLRHWSYHHHFICPIMQQYAHLHEYDSRRAGQQGPIRTLTAALKRSIKTITGCIFYMLEVFKNKRIHIYIYPEHVCVQLRVCWQCGTACIRLLHASCAYQSICPACLAMDGWMQDSFIHPASLTMQAVPTMAIPSQGLWHSYSAFSALTLLVGWQKGRPACKKNWVVRCWRGYLSGARCGLAYCPADSTSAHCPLLQ